METQWAQASMFLKGLRGDWEGLGWLKGIFFKGSGCDLEVLGEGLG